MKQTRKPATKQPPNCSVCDTRPADGTLFVNYDPLSNQRSLQRSLRGDDPPMNRGWSLHLPICGPCVRASVSVGVKMDLKNEQGTWAHLDRVPR